VDAANGRRGTLPGDDDTRVGVVDRLTTNLRTFPMTHGWSINELIHNDFALCSGRSCVKALSARATLAGIVFVLKPAPAGTSCLPSWSTAPE
jgi:hypothetical protein